MGVRFDRAGVSVVRRSDFDDFTSNELSIRALLDSRKLLQMRRPSRARLKIVPVAVPSLRWNH